MMHEASAKLASGSAITPGGPWWFVQMFLHLHFARFCDRPSLSDISFPLYDLQVADLKAQRAKEGLEDDCDSSSDTVTRSCTSYGKAIFCFQGAPKLSGPLIAEWFKCLYIGPDDETTIWYPYD